MRSRRSADSITNLVIATQNIEAGTVITENMIGLVSLPNEDMSELRITQPGREFIADTASVVGQTAAVDIFWFQPIEQSLLGEPIDPCSQPGVSCPDVPEGYYTINFPMNPTVEGLAIGDRVDVLAVADGQLRVIVENVLLADIQPRTIVLASPSWQLSVLIWLSQSGETYALRLHTAEPPSVSGDMVEYSFTAPEPLPDDYLFDLIVGIPAAKGYLLTNLPAPIDAIPYTERDGLMQFWFKAIELVRVEDGTEVTLRLPEGYALNLDYLINLDASLTFVPDEDTAYQR